MKSFAFLLLLVGCTALTEDERYVRNDELAIARDHFQELSRNCKAIGGYMVVTRPLRELRNWSKWDYQSAKCATRRIY